MTLKPVFAASALAALAACSTGSSGGGSLEDQMRNDTRDAIADLAEVYSYAPTAFSAMPSTGSATFRGKASMTIEQTGGADDINILGDSVLTARFGPGRITGAVTDMVGTRGNPLRPDRAFNVDGRIDIGQDISIIGNDVDDTLTSVPNDWYADAQGRISVPGATFDIEGDVGGKFMGTRVGPTGGDAIRAIEGSSFDMIATRDGRERAVFFDIYGLN